MDEVGGLDSDGELSEGFDMNDGDEQFVLFGYS